MNLIVAVDQNWGIGKLNGLLFSIPEDMKFFRSTTLNKVVCMGYNTLLSFPESKPLKNRVNVVLAPEGVERDDCIVVHDLKSLFDKLSAYDSNDVFVIGGGMFYKTMLPYCKNAYVTEVFANGDATVFFENLDKLSNWEKSYLSEVKKSGDLSFRFTLYQNSDVKLFE